MHKSTIEFQANGETATYATYGAARTALFATFGRDLDIGTALDYTSATGIQSVWQAVSASEWVKVAELYSTELLSDEVA